MKSYFKFLSRNKLYTAIEAFGLSIALAFVMILVSYAFMEYRVGTHQPDAKNLYVPGSGDYLGMTLGTAKEFFPSIPEIKEWTRFSDYYTDKGAVVNDQYYHVQARAIDPNFLDMMGMKCSLLDIAQYHTQYRLTQQAAGSHLLGSIAYLRHGEIDVIEDG